MWKGECSKPCVKVNCADCRMRLLFHQASNNLKPRYAEIERRIKSSGDVGDTWHDYDNADPFNWKEFEQLYYESYLFKWHRDAYLEDGILDLEEMKRIWMEKEKSYEKSFIDDAKKRISQDESKNIKKKTKRKKG
ncbi:hypothetical protein BGZ65_001039 [Modicella reniformis]|uniref:Uncharacterized protein n=1 Tax=Modicella reniformis TaxID=1440133 RepID=A0A9P6SUF0_9FUNG|nr:hypothetical protein BGZ65_001039 [Modicella reniformis]